MVKRDATDHQTVCQPVNSEAVPGERYGAKRYGRSGSNPAGNRTLHRSIAKLIALEMDANGADNVPPMEH